MTQTDTTTVASETGAATRNGGPMAGITRRGLLSAGAIVVVLAFLALLPLLNLYIPYLLPSPTYKAGTLQMLAVVLTMAALALTYHMVFGVAGLLSFGHALYFAAGLYGLGILLRYTELGFVPAIGIALALSVLLATVVGAISLRVGGIAFAMVTLAFAEAGSVLVKRNPGGLTGAEEGLGLASDSVPAIFLGVANTKYLFWLALAVFVFVLVVVTWVERSRGGHVAMATRENELRVRVLGMNPYRARLVAFVVGGSLAAIVGMSYLLVMNGAQVHATTPDLTISLLIMVMLGGVGSRVGAVIGAVLYSLFDQRLPDIAAHPALAELPSVLRIPLTEPLFLLGSLFVLVMLFMPGGITGAFRRADGTNRRRLEKPA